MDYFENYITYEEDDIDFTSKDKILLDKDNEKCTNNKLNESNNPIEVHNENQKESTKQHNKVDLKNFDIDLPILPIVNAAPDISIPLIKPLLTYHNPTDHIIYTNPPIENLSAPIQGPLTPLSLSRGGFARQLQNHLTGQVDVHHMNSCSFDRQYNSYQITGIAANPSDHTFYINHNSNSSPSQPPLIISTGLDGAKPSPKVQDIEHLQNQVEYGSQFSSKREKKKKPKRPFSDPSSNDYLGPWAPKIDESESTVAPAPKKPTKASTSASEAIPPKVITIFHGKSEKDYQGRSFIEPPPNTKEFIDEQVNYIPKKNIFTYVGHTMGVQAIRFFPKSGHLLLSASLDSQVRIWDIYNQRKCMRSYLGHDLGVRDITFTPDGKKFYSCSYDKKILLWDTEYGKIIQTFTNGHTPYCVSVNTDDPDIVITGSSNKKAVQFDAKTGGIVQEYNEHLAAVNSVTFCEQNRKIVTTSDDKKIFIWDYGIPVVVKHIAEPSMHSMPSVTVHPSQKYFAAQSMDNQIVVYESFGRFRYQSRKQFKGHISAGYAIHPGFSPDGQYIMSGDAGGRLWFWEWKTMKNYRTLQCHSGVCIDCAWHPTMTSRVATCGWDGLIKLWD